MLLRFLSTLLLSIFIFYNKTLFWSIIFTSILLIFAILFRVKFKRKIFFTFFLSGLTIMFLQIIFRRGSNQNPIFSYHFIKIYGESLIIGGNVFFVLFSMVLILFILQTLEPEIIFSRIEQCPITKFLTLPLYSAYRFFPIVSHQIKSMNYYAKIRIAKNNTGFKKTLKIYIELLIPLFVSIYRRIFFITLSAERKNYKNLNHYFEKKEDICDIKTYIFFATTLISIILFIMYPEVWL